MAGIIAKDGVISFDGGSTAAMMQIFIAIAAVSGTGAVISVFAVKFKAKKKYRFMK